MKKVLSVLCMALLAGGMIFTSCNKQYTITVESNNPEWGTVTGGGTFDAHVTTTLTATPKPGYQFVKWQDGVKDTPRTITVTADATYTAYFEAIPEPTVKVNFNGNNWQAGSISARYYESAGVWDVYSSQTEGNYPIADVATSILSGSSSATADVESGELGGDFNWVEYYNETALVDGNNTYYGDYWAKSVTCAVTAFDPTALTLSSNVNGTMFSALEAFVSSAGAVGVEAASTAPMTVNMINIELASAKGTPTKKVVGKLAVK